MSGLQSWRKKVFFCASLSDPSHVSWRIANDFQCVQDRFDLWNLVGSEQICFSERGKDGKEGLRTAHLIAKVFEGVRQRVANGESEGTKAERIKKNGHLMADANGAVLKIAVVEAEAGIEEDLFHASAFGNFDLAGEVIAHHADGIDAEIEVSNFADVFALDVANDHRGVVGGGEAKEFIVMFSGSEVENFCAGFETGASDGRLIRLY